MARLLSLWQNMLASLWFVPVTVVVAAVGLALALVEVDSRLGERALEAWPMLFGASPGGARHMLATIASSTITIAGVVFSITLVALSLASSQYSSRVLRNFMSDRGNQTVLGVFVGIFAYCLVVVRTIREDSVGEFVPSVAVLVGVCLAFAGVGFFIYFIHHIAVSIQASRILARIAGETIRVIDHVFPDAGEDLCEQGAETASAVNGNPGCWRPVPADRTGYIQRAEPNDLVALARELGAVVRMEHCIGDFVVEGSPLVSVRLAGEPDTRALGRAVGAFTIDQQRTTDQDAAFGLRQIVDMALKALSPGINDTTTATMSLDYLTAILLRLCDRRIESPCRYEGGQLRVITRGQTFGGLVGLAFDQIRQNAGGNVAVLSRLLDSLAALEERTLDASRRGSLQHQARAVDEAVRRSIPSPFDREVLEARAGRLLESLKRERSTGDKGIRSGE